MDKTKNVYEEKAIDIPAIKRHSEEDPSSQDESKRKLFYDHKTHFFILTTVGKPIFSKYGEDYTISNLSATISALISKFQCLTYGVKPESDRLK
jgi:hypothetical protein